MSLPSGPPPTAGVRLDAAPPRPPSRGDERPPMFTRPIDDKRPQEVTVGMGQVALVETGQVASAVLGSCIGLVLFQPRRSIAVMSHIVLAESRGNATSLPGKFADTAISHMLGLLSARGILTSQVRAKLAGGATMFGGRGPIRIGDQNHRAVREILGRFHIPILGEHVGGEQGRRVVFCPTQTRLTVEVAGQTVIVL